MDKTNSTQNIISMAAHSHSQLRWKQSKYNKNSITVGFI